MDIKQSSATEPLIFLLVSNVDHITGLTGATPTVTISKNGGAFAVPSGSVVEIGNGLYAINPNAVDTNTLGPIVIHATAAGADPCDDRTYRVVAYNPYDIAALGLSRLDQTVSSVAGQVWDRALSLHTVVGTFGAKINAFAGSVSGGSIAYTYTLLTAVGVPISAANIYVTTDSSGSDKIAEGVTGADGSFTVFLNPGIYYFWRQKRGWSFVNPDVETVSA